MANTEQQRTSETTEAAPLPETAKTSGIVAAHITDASQTMRTKATGSMSGSWAENRWKDRARKPF
jgi:hypothetical protein